jgi:hypothetical protein
MKWLCVHLHLLKSQSALIYLLKLGTLTDSTYARTVRVITAELRKAHFDFQQIWKEKMSENNIFYNGPTKNIITVCTVPFINDLSTIRLSDTPPDSRVVKATGRSLDGIRKPLRRAASARTVTSTTPPLLTRPSLTQYLEVRDGSVRIGRQRARRAALDGDQHVGPRSRRRDRGGRCLVRDLRLRRRGVTGWRRALPPAGRRGGRRAFLPLRAHW